MIQLSDSFHQQLIFTDVVYGYIFFFLVFTEIQKFLAKLYHLPRSIERDKDLLSLEIQENYCISYLSPLSLQNTKSFLLNKKYIFHENFQVKQQHVHTRTG